MPALMGGPLSIGIDFRPALSRETGVGRYFRGLVLGLAAVDRESRYVLFSSSLKERPKPMDLPPNFTLVDRRVPVRVLNALWHRRGVPSLDLLAGRRFDVTHSPTPLVLPSRGAASVVTVCDLFFLDHPEATSREIRRDYARLAREHVHRADAVVAISQTTADDVERRLDVPREKIAVVRAGLDPRFALESPPPPPDGGPPYLLAVASEEPRKNLPRLVEAVAVLVDRGWDGELRIAGGPGLDSTHIGEAIARFHLRDRVARLGYVDAETLASLYRKARAVVLPSIWEGFGLPLIEAMACAVPVVASDIPVHHEVAGDAAIFARGDDADALAVSIERAWGDEELRRRLLAAGRERVRLFSWEASAQKALEVYRDVARR